jgi:ABC-type proline/glycine betaine transport system ATPase subunit
MVTHDRDQARRLCHRVAFIDAGKLVRVGRPEEVLLA